MEQVLSPEYWESRSKRSKETGQRHQAVFLCHFSKWKAIETRHREILRETIRPTDSVLDVGCGYGRLIDMMPDDWTGRYVGVDVYDGFVSEGIERHRGRPCTEFVTADVRDLGGFPFRFDWAVMISVRPMIKRNCGEGVWGEMERVVKSLVGRILYLEYDENDKGEIV